MSKLNGDEITTFSPLYLITVSALQAGLEEKSQVSSWTIIASG